MEDCFRVPELTEIIISFLGLKDQLVCLQVNSTWNKLATPRVVQGLIHYLSIPQYFKRIRECKAAQVSLRRNLGHAQDLNIYDKAVVDLISGSDTLVNLLSLHWGILQHDPECTANILKIIRKNPKLRSVIFHGNPFHGLNGVPVEQLASALQPLAHLASLKFMAWSNFNIADMKALLDSLPMKSLKSLRMKVCIQDDNLDGRMKALSSKGLSDNILEESGSTPLDLETLSIVATTKYPHDGEATLYRSLVFSILRRCPNLKCLSVSALEREHIAELSVIFQTICPSIERLKFNSHSDDPDERACTDLILSCPKLKRIKNRFGSAWDMTEFVPRIIRYQDFCLRIKELNLNTTQSLKTSEWMQQLFCSLPNLRIYKQSIDPDADGAAHLNICDMVRSRWVCNKLEKLYLALGSTSDGPEEEETGTPETVEQRKRKIRQVYEQFGALTQLKELGIRYDIQKRSPVHFDMTFKTGLKAMRACVSSLRFLEILEMKRCRIGEEELDWMENLGLTRNGVLFMMPDSESEEDDGSDPEYVYEEDFEDGL